MADLGAFQALMEPGVEPASLLELLTGSRPSWYRDAACVEHRELSWFPELGQPAGPAKAICGSCLVVAECLDYALDDPGLVGVWGGTSPRERGRLRRARIALDAA